MKTVTLAVSLEDWPPFSYPKVSDVLGKRGEFEAEWVVMISYCVKKIALTPCRGEGGFVL